MNGGLLRCNQFIPNAACLAIFIRILKDKGFSLFFNMSSTDPLGISSVTIIKFPGSVQAPMKSNTFGWRSFAMIATSFLKANNVSESTFWLISFFTATSFPNNVPLYTTPNAPLPNSLSITISCGSKLQDANPAVKSPFIFFAIDDTSNTGSVIGFTLPATLVKFGSAPPSKFCYFLLLLLFIIYYLLFVI